LIEINLAIEGVAGLLTPIWIGLTILLLAAVRIPWRIANPPLKVIPTGFGRWLVEWTGPVSRIMQDVLYALLVLVPAAGIALQFARGIRCRSLGSRKSPHRGSPTELSQAT